MEQELVGGDGEHGLRHLPDSGNEKILDILGCQNHGRVLLPDPLHAVADVLNGSPVGQEQVQLVNGCHGVADTDQGITHV